MSCTQQQSTCVIAVGSSHRFKHKSNDSFAWACNVMFLAFGLLQQVCSLTRPQEYLLNSQINVNTSNNHHNNIR